MLFFPAGILSVRGAGFSDPQGDPGKGREDKNIRIWEFRYPREAAPEGKKPPVGGGNDDFREEGFDLQAQLIIAEGGESGGGVSFAN